MDTIQHIIDNIVNSSNPALFLSLVVCSGLGYYVINQIKKNENTLLTSLTEMKAIHKKCEQKVTKLTFILLKVMHKSDGINLPLVEKEVEELLMVE